MLVWMMLRRRCILGIFSKETENQAVYVIDFVESSISNVGMCVGMESIDGAANDQDQEGRFLEA